MIPILFQHDPTKIIGKIEYENDSLIITFSENFHITREQFQKMMNCGFVIVESYIVKSIIYLRKVRVLELSYEL